MLRRLSLFRLTALFAALVLTWSLSAGWSAEHESITARGNPWAALCDHGLAWWPVAAPVLLMLVESE